jgi:hypothetical protein
MSRRIKRPDPAHALTVREQLELFVDRSRQLWESRVRREGLKVSINMKWGAEDQMLTTALDEPDAEDFRSYLLTFRQFISEGEPLYLHKIYNLCHQHITDDRCKEYLAEARGIWQQISKRSDTGMTLTLDSVALSPVDVADLWINGHYFHNDPEKIRTLKGLESYLYCASRTIFLDYVIETSKIIFHAGRTIHVALKRGWVQA